jgi:predicted outer membrane repeat protein
MPLIVNCLFIDNHSFCVGGAIYCEGCSPLILNCLFAGNVSQDNGGAIYGTPFIRGCTFTENEAYYSQGGAVAGDSDQNKAQILNSILWGNTPDQALYAAVVWSDVQGGWAGSGNIAADPLFVNPAASDYHLQAGSPCIDAGTPTFPFLPGEIDLDGQRRVWDGNGDGQPRADMGVDEYGSFVYGDLNCDGAVDFGDINPYVLALTDPAAYGTTFPACDVLNADINVDGTVDFRDINPFVALLTGGGRL